MDGASDPHVYMNFPLGPLILTCWPMVRRLRYLEMFPFSYDFSSQLVHRWTRQYSTYLDDQVEMSFVLIKRGGRVTPHNLLPIDLSGDRDVLTDRQTKTVVGVRYRESVSAKSQHPASMNSSVQDDIPSGVVGQTLFVDQSEWSPFDRVQHRSRYS